MYRRLSRVLAPCCAVPALALASCSGGQTLESVASSWTFSPPSGWTMMQPPPNSSNGPRIGEWFSPDGRQRLSFGAFRRADEKATVLPPGVLAVGTVKLCGGRPATLLRLENSHGVTIGEAVAMQWHNMRATATYFYPLSPDPRAEAALRTICPKGDAPQT
jgi:hypothetical protein